MNKIIWFILLPLFSAFLTPVGSLINKKFARFLNQALFIAGIVLGVLIFPEVLRQPVVIALGGWAPPFGINLYVSSLSLGAALIIYVIALLSSINGLDVGRESYYYLLFALFVFASIGMVMTGDIFNLFVFMEIAAISTIGLSAGASEKAGSRGAFKYLVNSGVVSMFMLSAVAILYALLGTLNIAHIGRGEMINASVAFLIALGILSALFLESELFPFSLWVPDVYKGSATSFSAALSGVTGIAGIVVVARILFTMMNPSSAFQLAQGGVNAVLFVIAIVSILAGEFAALNARDFKKLLGYSSIGQMGQIVLALAIASHALSSYALTNTAAKNIVAIAPLSGALYLLLAHTLAKPMLLFIAGFFIKITGKSSWEDMKGLARVYPFLGAAFAIGGLTLMGVPLFAGFWGKIELIKALFGGNWLAWIGLIVLLIGSVIEGVYFMRIAHYLFEKTDTELPPRRWDFRFWLAFIPVGVLLIGLVAVGIWPGLVDGFIRNMAGELLDSGGYIRNVLGGFIAGGGL